MGYRIWNEKYRHYYTDAIKVMDEEIAYKYYQYAVRKNSHGWKDSERSKTYDAEWKFEANYPHVTKELTLKECRTFAKRVLKSKLWENFNHKNDPAIGLRSACKTVRIEQMRSNSLSGVCYRELIRLSESGMNKYVVLHELAHAAGFGKHDYRFRECLIRLVSRFLGREEAKALKKCFREKKLRVSRPIIKSPEAWLKAVDRAPIKIVA
jgi:predicted metal-dependent hydrolase